MINLWIIRTLCGDYYSNKKKREILETKGDYYYTHKLFILILVNIND